MSEPENVTPIVPLKVTFIPCLHCGRRVAAVPYLNRYPTWRVCAACRGGTAPAAQKRAA
jgi:hypothetical protein